MYGSFQTVGDLGKVAPKNLHLNAKILLPRTLEREENPHRGPIKTA
jgi:hypothetical protein